MSEFLFQGFGNFSRPDIGLISDSFQNLSEIFESDKRQALRNILISPEVLDSIYGLSTSVSREDIRSASGLSDTLLSSLHQLSEVFEINIPNRLFIDKEFFNADVPLGGPGSPVLKTPNVILYNGNIQCQGVKYKSNVINQRLFSNPSRSDIYLSSSRASLFNIEQDDENPGYFKTSSYPGPIRVRRRSHVNRIFIPRDSILPKAPILENPSYTIQLGVDNGNTGTETELKLLATKNSPLKVLCRLGVGSVKFTFSDSERPYFYGYQIQPLQQRQNRPRVDFIPVTQVSQLPGTREFILNIDITGSGFQNLFDVYLYLYVNPEKVTGIEFSGINIRETGDGKDIGLIGFNNLESLVLSDTSVSILPIWLKTLSNKLVNLNLENSGDTWRNGPMGWFDIRNPSATPSFQHPLYTCVSYLTIPKKGPMVAATGDDWSDELFEKYILDQERTPGTDFRVFSSVRSISLRDRFLLNNPRFDDVFPNLTSLNLNRRSGNQTDERRTYRYLFGSLPKINNNGNQISYNIFGSLASGDIIEIGTSTDPEDNGHISKYKFSNFNIGGRDQGRHDIDGFINNPDEDWANWRESCVSINTNRTNVNIDLQNGIWSSLASLEMSLSEGGVIFDDSAGPFKTPNLVNAGFFGCRNTGKIPSLGSSPIENTGALVSINLGGSRSELLPYTSSGINFLLPPDFAPVRGAGSEHKLKQLIFSESVLNYKFRQNDLKELYDLETISLRESSLTGRFPIVPSKKVPEFETKPVRIISNGSRFYDLSNLSIASSNSIFGRDVVEIVAWGQNSADGGSILPNFEGVSNSTVTLIDISNSLISTYRGDWFNPSLRGSCVRDSDPASEISGLSITRRIPTEGVLNEKDNEYVLTGGTGFKQRVLVNDSVRFELSGVELARVLSVKDNEIVIDRDIPGTLPSALIFTRNSNSINNWFRRGFSGILQFRCADNRLSGKLNIRSGFGRIVDSDRAAFDLSRNFISEYEGGSLTKIFSGNNRKITINLSGNNFSLETLSVIITEILEIEKLRKFTNCFVRLDGNKITADGKYSQYTQQEVFPVIVSAGNDVVTSLSRSETFNAFRIVNVADQFGQVSQSIESVGTRTLNVPGALVSGQYYKTKRDKTQQIAENPLGSRFKNLSGIRIGLGFNYVSPRTGSTVISTEYEDPTTRNQSITDSGLEQLASCPSGISGSCWRRSSDGLILRI
jgi:hypothetical protein